MTSRRFPPPWQFDDNGACFIVKDKNGQALAYAQTSKEAWAVPRCKPAYPRRSPQDRDQHRQAAGAGEAAAERSPS